MRDTYRKRIYLHVGLLGLFAALFIIGTFLDEPVAAAVYAPDVLPAVIVTTLGLYPFFASQVMFAGVLTQKAVTSQKPMWCKLIMIAVLVGLSVYSGIKGSGSLVSIDCLGGMFESLRGSRLVTAGIFLTAICPLYYVGYRLGKKTCDRQLVKKMIMILLIMLAAVIIMDKLKSAFSRPRYRIVVRQLEGIGFVPWYKPFSGAGELRKTYGLTGSDFRSFPSGHSIMSVSCVYIFYSLSWVEEKLRDRQLTLCIAGALFGMIVMFTRMLLGAHYLSDVSAGAMIATVLSLIFTLLENKLSKEVSP